MLSTVFNWLWPTFSPLSANSVYILIVPTYSCGAVFVHRTSQRPTRTSWLAKRTVCITFVRSCFAWPFCERVAYTNRTLSPRGVWMQNAFVWRKKIVVIKWATNVGCFTLSSFERCSVPATDREAAQHRNRANAFWRKRWNMKIDCICVKYVETHIRRQK